MRKKSEMTKIRNNRSLLLICLIALLATVLRLHNLDGKSMWFDEIYSVSYTKNPLSIVYDDAPPLYFYALRYWMILGDTAFVLRLLSAIFGLLMVPLTYLAGRDFFGSKEGLLASAFMAVSLLGIQESQSARPYTLVGFFGFLSFYSFYKAVSTGKKLWWAVFCVSTMIAVYAHYLVFLLVIAETTYILAHRNRHHTSLKLFFICLLVMALAYTPWIFFLVKESGLNGLRVHTYPSVVVVNSYVPVVFYRIISYFSNTKYLLPLFIAAILYGIYTSFRRNTMQYNLLIAGLIIPTGVGVLLMARAHAKYFMYVLPAYYLLSSKGITSIKDRNLMFTVILSILIVSSGSLVGYYNSEIADWRSVAGYIHLNAGVDDVVLIIPSSERISFKYYFREDELEILSLTESDGTPSKTRRVLDRYPGRNMWIVCTDQNRMKYDPEGHITAFLEENMAGKTEFTWITVYMFKA